MKAQDFISEVRKGNIDVVKHTEEVIKQVKKINKDYNYFNVVSEELALEQAKKVNKKGKLAGLPISVKDCICVKDVESRAGSKILSGYKPVFNATCIQRIIDEGVAAVSVLGHNGEVICADCERRQINFELGRPHKVKGLIQRPVEINAEIPIRDRVIFQ